MIHSGCSGNYYRCLCSNNGRRETWPIEETRDQLNRNIVFQNRRDELAVSRLPFNSRPNESLPRFIYFFFFKIKVNGFFEIERKMRGQEVRLARYYLTRWRKVYSRIVNLCFKGISKKNYYKNYLKRSLSLVSRYFLFNNFQLSRGYRYLSNQNYDSERDKRQRYLDEMK